MGVVSQRSELRGWVEGGVGTSRQVEFDVRLTGHAARQPGEKITIVAVVSCLRVSDAQVPCPVAPRLVHPGHSQPAGAGGTEVPPDWRVGR